MHDTMRRPLTCILNTSTLICFLADRFGDAWFAFLHQPAAFTFFLATDYLISAIQHTSIARKGGGELMLMFMFPFIHCQLCKLHRLVQKLTVMLHATMRLGAKSVKTAAHVRLPQSLLRPSELLQKLTVILLAGMRQSACDTWSKSGIPKTSGSALSLRSWQLAHWPSATTTQKSSLVKLLQHVLYMFCSICTMAYKCWYITSLHSQDRPDDSLAACMKSCAQQHLHQTNTGSSSSSSNRT